MFEFFLIALMVLLPILIIWIVAATVDMAIQFRRPISQFKPRFRSLFLLNLLTAFVQVLVIGLNLSHPEPWWLYCLTLGSAACFFWNIDGARKAYAMLREGD